MRAIRHSPSALFGCSEIYKTTAHHDQLVLAAGRGA
jgi:hypothetical protein